EARRRLAFRLPCDDRVSACNVSAISPSLRFSIGQQPQGLGTNDESKHNILAETGRFATPVAAEKCLRWQKLWHAGARVRAEHLANSRRVCGLLGRRSETAVQLGGFGWRADLRRQSVVWTRLAS